MMLLKLVKTCENLRLLFLSATPMYNSHKEIIWLANIMNQNDQRSTIKSNQVFQEDGSFVPEKKDKDGIIVRESGKDILKRKDLVKPTLEIFGFGKKDRVMNISLEQIYHFFQLLGVKYANLMDYTCRACSVGRLPQNLTDSMYRTEQQYRIKPVAFGKRSKKKQSEKKRSKKKRSRKIRRNK